MTSRIDLALQVATELLPAAAAVQSPPQSPSASRFSRGSAVPHGSPLATALLAAERDLAATHLTSSFAGGRPRAASERIASVHGSVSPSSRAPRAPASEGGEPRDDSDDDSSARGVLVRSRSSGDSDDDSSSSETSPPERLDKSLGSTPCKV